jgi:hypothetical protein
MVKAHAMPTAWYESLSLSLSLSSQLCCRIKIGFDEFFGLAFVIVIPLPGSAGLRWTAQKDEGEDQGS